MSESTITPRALIVACLAHDGEGTPLLYRIPTGEPQPRAHPSKGVALLMHAFESTAEIEAIIKLQHPDADDFIYFDEQRDGAMFNLAAIPYLWAPADD